MAVEGGLIVKWTRDIEWNSRDRSYAMSGPKVLTLEHILPAFVVYSLFASFAIGAFIAEHVVHYHIRRASVHRFWLVADGLIDGQRHYLLPWSIITGRWREF